MIIACKAAVKYPMCFFDYYRRYSHFAFLLIFVIASKFLIISLYGNATPFWDQWDSEADLLYRPWLEGNYQWFNLWDPHNEHRIFTTRVIALLLLELNGRVWNPLLQMYFNVFLHLAAIFTLLILLTRCCSSVVKKHILTIFTGLMFSVPFGWENLLSGFNSQAYLLHLFSIGFIYIISRCTSFAVSWWIALSLGFLSFFSMASGALSLLVGAIVLGLRRFWFKECGRVTSLSIFVLTLAAFVAIYMTPDVPAHDSLKASSVLDFIRALFKLLSWPATSFWFAFIIQAPMLALAVRLLNSRSNESVHAFILGIIGWFFFQLVAIAYARAAAPLASRYLDMLCYGLVVNFFAILHLYSNISSSLQKMVGIFAVIWVVVLVIGLGKLTPIVREELSYKAATSLEQQTNVRAYLCSGDISSLENKPFLHIPYPDPIRLAKLLDSSTIQKILPGNIYLPHANIKVGNDGEPFCNTGAPWTPFKVVSVPDYIPAHLANLSSIKVRGWLGTDYFKSIISGFIVIGSYIHSENDTGMLVLRMKQGQKLLYRAGARAKQQFIIINNGLSNGFKTSLPSLHEWGVLEFSHPNLPPEFDVTLIDAGTSWDEWSAVALFDNRANYQFQ